MEISSWLEKFKDLWVSKDLQGVMALFSEDVVYFETPFLQLKSKKEILDEWRAIAEQEEINLNYSVFSKINNKSAVVWNLSYKLDGQILSRKGTYLIELDNKGLCKYFHQTCEGQE